MRSSVGVGTVLVVLCVAVVLGAATDTRLIEAARSGNTSAVTNLLRQRVPVNEAEADGTTALHWAAASIAQTWCRRCFAERPRSTSLTGMALHR